MQTPNIENIEKNSGFPKELLIKERDLLLFVLTKFTGSEYISLLFRESLARIFFIFSYSLLQTPNIEHIEKNSGFPEKLLGKERSKFAN